MRKNQRIIATGFASPADDFLERPLDLNKLVVKNPTSTFFFRYQGEEIPSWGVRDGDILVVDRAVTPKSGNLIVAVCGGEFILREIKIKNRKLYLINNEIIEEPALCGDFEIWGIVTHIIRKTV